MKKEGLFQIGEVAKMFHLSVGSLRHYEKAGLLSPEYIDPATGYRYYSTRQFEILNTIRYLRVLQMPLEQIADFLNNRDIDKIQRMLHNQKNTVIQKQNELKIVEKKIENRLRQIQDALSSELDTISIKQIPRRRIAWLEQSLSIHSYDDLETSIRQLERHQSDTAVFLGKVGVGISRDNLLHAHYDHYDRVFLILDDEDIYAGNVDVLEEETCVTLRFCGSHKDASIHYEKLVHYISENGLTITGFSKEITMIDYGITNDTTQFVTEIQVPVD